MATATILYTRSTPGGKVHPPALQGDAGFDVEVAEGAVLAPGSVTRVNLGIALAIPDGLAFTFMTRSGAIRQGMFVLPTLIDSGYRGPLYLFVLNTSMTTIALEPGVRIAQIVLLANLGAAATLQEVLELPVSKRGVRAFNSTGGGVT